MKNVSENERLVYSICLSFTGNTFDAEDLAQETFISAYNSRSSFDGKNFKAWVTKIAANKAKDFLRQRREMSDIDLEPVADIENQPEDIILKNDSMQTVELLIYSLDEPYKTVAEKYFIQDIKISELAEATHQNIKTLQTQLYRAKKLLRNLWREKNAYKR